MHNATDRKTNDRMVERNTSDHKLERKYSKQIIKTIKMKTHKCDY